MELSEIFKERYNLVEEIFNERSSSNGVFSEFCRQLIEQLEQIDEDEVWRMRDVIKHWNEEDIDWDKADKLTILYKYSRIL